MVQHFVTVLAANTANDTRWLESLLGRAVTGDDLEPDNLVFGQMGAAVTAADYIAAINGNHLWARRLLSWWHPADGSRGFDLLLTPTIAVPPPPIGFLSGPEGGARVADVLQFTVQLNVSGQPAINLPLHVSADGLPVGVQLVAAHGREDVLVRVAAQLEDAAPWAAQRPLVRA